MREDLEIGFIVEDGGLTPVVLGPDDLRELRVTAQRMEADADLRASVQAARRRVMAVTHGLADPGD